MVINLLANNGYHADDYVQDFYYYDYEDKEMKHYRGGRMALKYEYDSEKGKGKLVPVFKDVKTKTYRNNWPEIEKWVTQNGSKVEVIEKSPKRSFQIELDDDAYAWFRKEMSKHSIHYEEEEA